MDKHEIEAMADRVMKAVESELDPASQRAAVYQKARSALLNRGYPIDVKTDRLINSELDELMGPVDAA